MARRGGFSWMLSSDMPLVDPLVSYVLTKTLGLYVNYFHRRRINVGHCCFLLSGQQHWMLLCGAILHRCLGAHHSAQFLVGQRWREGRKCFIAAVGVPHRPSSICGRVPFITERARLGSGPSLGRCQSPALFAVVVVLVVDEISTNKPDIFDRAVIWYRLSSDASLQKSTILRH